MTSHTKQSLTALKVQDLKNLCIQHGLHVSGNKSDLIGRLMSEFGVPSTNSNHATPVKASPTRNKSIPTSTSAARHEAKEISPKNDYAKKSPAEATQQPNQPIADAPKKWDPKPDPPSNKQPTSATTTTPTAPSELTPISLEIARRKQRAERFGIEPTTSTITLQETEEEKQKKLYRAQKFGISVSNDASSTMVASHGALDQPLRDSKNSNHINSSPAKITDLEWEAKKRKRAEKFGLVDYPSSNHTNIDGHKQQRKFNRSRY